MEVVIIIVSLLGGILGLILFFKIWGATNNVKKIQRDLSSPTPVSKATTKAAMLVALGEIDAAREILNDD